MQAETEARGTGGPASLSTGVVVWAAQRTRWQRGALGAIAGALITAGHPPVGQPWTLFLAMPLVVWLTASATGPRAAAWIGWTVGFGYFATSLHWIGHAFLVDPDRFALLMPVGVVAFPGALALFWAVAFAVARWVWPGGLLMGAVYLSACIALVEYARSHLFTGFPWALPGYVWVDTPVMQTAAWIGPHGITLATLLLTPLPLIAALKGGAGTLRAAALIALGGVIWTAGATRVPEGIAYRDNPLRLRLVQPNAPQHLKWDPEHAETFYRRALEATAEPGDPDIVIWPETAVTFVPAANPGEVARISEAAGDATVILGALHGEATPNGERWYNSLVVIGPDGRLGPRYDKHHLVPFGEYVPFAWILGALGVEQFAVRGGFDRGPGPETLTVPGLPDFAALICYEAIFPEEVVGEIRPEWMVQLTNDAWFGTFAGPQQHYAQARIRAIEQGLPMVRAANTGISAVVDPYGREVVSLDLDNHGRVDAKLPAPLPPTLYSRTGDIPAVLLIAFLVFVMPRLIVTRPGH